MEEDTDSSLLDCMENKQYLDEHHLRIYLEDSIVQMCALRQESNKIKPIKFFREYFCSVQQGSHILFREFSFVDATPYNRLCVLKSTMQIYKPLLYRVEKLSAMDYHSLLQLIWPDFPLDIIEKTFASINEKEKDSEVQISFLKFISALRKTFCTGSFTYEENKIYQQLLLREEEYSKIDTDDQSISEFSDKHASYLSEADLIDSIQENDCEQDASAWSMPTNIVPNSELHKFLCMKESNSFSNDEPFEAIGKLSRSSSGSKDSKPEQGTVSVSRPSSASLRGRLCTKQLSNSLNLLQPEKQESDSQFPMRRLRSKSAVTIQRSSTVLHKP